MAAIPQHFPPHRITRAILSGPPATHRSHIGRILITLLVVLDCALPAQSQVLRHDRDQAKGVSIAMLRPSFEAGTDARFLSMALTVAGHMSLSERVDLRAELPLSQYGLKESGTINTAFGNPYLGLDVASATLGVVGELGLRVPLGSDEMGLRSGIASDIGRWDAFFGDAISIQGGLRYVYAVTSDLDMELQGGSDFWVYTRRDIRMTMDWFYTYGVQLWYTEGALRLGSGLVGRALVTPRARLENQLPTRGWTAHQVNVSAVWLSEWAQPGVHLLLPVDDGLAYRTSYTLGISMTVPLSSGPTH